MIASASVINLAVLLLPAYTCADVQSKAREMAKAYADGFRVEAIGEEWTDRLSWYVTGLHPTPDEAQAWAAAVCAVRGPASRMAFI